MTSLIVGNWKMHGAPATVAAMADRLAGLDAPAARIVVCPPFPLLPAAVTAFAGGTVAIGAQDCHFAGSGAHTGDVAAPLLAALGCRYVIVGHSERRQAYRETDAVVRAKAQAAQAAGLVAIICVGETLAERDAGRAEAQIALQLDGSLPPAATDSNTVIAYEPIWAIGTGRVAAIADIAAMHAFIHARLAGRFTQVLYGGSVKPDNAAPILATPHVGGVLVGGASLVPDDFAAIAVAARS